MKSKKMKEKMKRVLAFLGTIVKSRKTKEILILFGCIVVGAAITTVIDNLIGVKQCLKDLSSVARIAHNVTYMLWGAVIVGLEKWLRII